MNQLQLWIEELNSYEVKVEVNTLCLFYATFNFRTYLRGLEWETLITKASVVWPESVLPLLSTIVPDTWSWYKENNGCQ